ncbi:MAG TPA: glycosyltransferase [Planctomycetota bacterium]|nr:glycosyltransferase [Planctomycetota bacterium]
MPRARPRRVAHRGEPRLTVAIVTPAPRGSLSGNRISALRYARIFRALGARVRVLEAWDEKGADLLVVLHARRGARSVLEARSQLPELPIVVVLTGTDVYRSRGPGGNMERALEAADAIVGLQSDSVNSLPRNLRRKARTILQSYDGPRPARSVARSRFDVLVLGHLRPEKDPFRAAMAARRLPPESRLRVLHAGKALSAAMARRAARESASNPRYQWLGELSRAKALAKLASARALVHTSRFEGGPGVFSEALALGVPILSSRIGASESIFGARHPGLFRYGSTAELEALMRRIEVEPRFLARLAAWSRRLAPRVAPGRELRAWRRLLGALGLSARR